MPITINDCHTHNLTPTVDVSCSVVIYCVECESLKERDDLYAGGMDFTDAVDQWNRMNPRRNNADNH